MDRRRFVAVCGSCLAGLAGCQTGSPAESPDDETPTPTPDPTGASPTEREPATTVTVEDVVVRKAVRYQSTMGSGGVLTGPDHQYVVASVSATGALSQSAFTFETDGGSWDPGLPDTRGAVNYSVAGHEGGPVGRPIGAGNRSYLAFTVPSPLSASNPRIRHTGSESSVTVDLPAEARARLPAPAPRFELVDLTAPEAVEHGDQFSVSLTARNVSETDGRFLAAVYWPTALVADDDESHLVERTVAAGSETTADLRLETEYTASESGPVPLEVTGHVTADRSVRLTDVTTPS